MSNPFIGHDKRRLIKEMEEWFAVEVILIERIRREGIDQADDHLKDHWTVDKDRI